MKKLKLRGKELIKLGYLEGRAIGIALQQMNQPGLGINKTKALLSLKAVLDDPAAFEQDGLLGPIAASLLFTPDEPELLQEAQAYPIYGAEQIEAGAMKQMDTAMRLPVTVAGALMPDAHLGYGLPIGGVLATDNAVIPYGVGVDIGCRMCLSVFDMKPSFLEKDVFLKDILNQNTRFGRSAFDRPMDNAVLESPVFREVNFVKRLKDKAFQQIGSSGSGNHFVEFGIVSIADAENDLNIEAGEYVALLSHSGSRGLGANIARHYTNIAMELCPLPKEAKHLAWLDLDSEAGQEYWLAMNLAGDYASACHHQIHERIAVALAQQPIARVENHHNFAWKEKDANGKELTVHRKGATPAGKGVLGVIPGSMTAPGYIVRGRGERTSLQSAAHGAGRLMSRTKAKASITQKQLQSYLKEQGVKLIGGGLDEAPFAYKDIREVMRLQADLIDIVGTFKPKIVRMDS